MIRVVVYDLTALVDTTVLSSGEVSRLQRFTRRDAARRWAAGRVGLRMILGEAVGIDPIDLVLSRGAHGKPALVDSALRFNKSDSGDLAAVALSADREVGLDIEQHRYVTRADRIAQRFFSDAERQELQGLAEPESRQAFFDCWTVKEAVLKCDGGGLGAIPMASYSAPLAPDWRGPISGRWWGARLQLGAGLSAAVVLAGTDEAAVEITYRTGDASARA